MSTRRPVAGVVTLAILGLLAAACGTIDGEDPYALWRSFAHPIGVYHFHYLSPPWEIGEGHSETTPVFVVDPELDPDPEGPGARLRLETHVLPDGELEDAVADVVHELHLNGYSTSPPTEFLSAAGDAGILIGARSEPYFVRAVLHRTEQRVVLLSLWGRGDPQDEDIDLLLAGFEPRPTEGD